MAELGSPLQRFFSRPLGRVTKHLFLWLLFVGFEYFVFSNWHEKPVVTWGFVLKDTIATICSYYFFSLVLLPRFLLRRRWLLTALGIVGIYYFWATLCYLCYFVFDHYGLVSKDAYAYMHRFLDGNLWEGIFSWRSVSMGLNDFSVTVIPPILLRFIQFLLSSGNQSLRLQRENLNLEVNFLKAQVNPHFLFNTLNNIYMMVVKQDERAPDMVQHLSHLMHYTVHESDAALVPVYQEVAFLESYLELERLRYGQKVSIQYEAPLIASGFSITPLLFFPFVENAFKHGVDSSLDASWVAISLRIVETDNEARLHFEVRNSYSPTAPQREFGGVGIANVRKRLALHYAPADYQLTITHDSDTYTYTYSVALIIRLAPTPAPVPRPVPSHPVLAPAS